MGKCGSKAKPQFSQAETDIAKCLNEIEASFGEKYASYLVGDFIEDVEILRTCSVDRLRKAGLSKKDAERVHVGLLLSVPDIDDGLSPRGALATLFPSSPENTPGSTVGSPVMTGSPMSHADDAPEQSPEAAKGKGATKAAARRRSKEVAREAIDH